MLVPTGNAIIGPRAPAEDDARSAPTQETRRAGEVHQPNDLNAGSTGTAGIADEAGDRQTVKEAGQGDRPHDSRATPAVHRASEAAVGKSSASTEAREIRLCGPAGFGNNGVRLDVHELKLDKRLQMLGCRRVLPQHKLDRILTILRGLAGVGAAAISLEKLAIIRNNAVSKAACVRAAGWTILRAADEPLATRKRYAAKTG